MIFSASPRIAVSLPRALLCLVGRIWPPARRAARDGWRILLRRNKRHQPPFGGPPMRYRSLAAFSLMLAATPLSAAAAPAGSIAAALASPDRRPDNVKLDEGRKPAAVLQYLGLEPGMQVLDLFGANGYWSAVMVPALGSHGPDNIWQPAQFL